MKYELSKKNAIAFAIFHVGMVVAIIFFPSFQGLSLAGVVFAISLCPGIGAGFHRLLTHRGYKTPKWVEYILTVCGYLALQGGAIWWVVWHRLHHKFTEIMGLDPHTPRDGRWWAHMDWMLHPDPKYRDPKLLKKMAPDLMKDRFHVFLNKYLWVPIALFGILVLSFGGFGAFCWAVFVPVVLGWHSTWLVNSATHLWGYRTHETKDDSRNNWWVALLTFGEGWHNNHHAHQRSVRHGNAWWEYDPNHRFIQLLQLLGLAKDLHYR